MRYSLVITLLLLIGGCSNNSERPYHLPYANGVEVRITADHQDHSTPDAEMFDLRAVERNQPLAAAAPGWVRFIQDGGNSNSQNNNYVWIEHPLDYCQPASPGGPSGPVEGGVCRTCPDGPQRCNEWTLYAHMQQDSVRQDANLTEGDWVTESQFIGTEGDVGFTPCAAGSTDPFCGHHVHFAVFVFEEDSLLAQPSENGDYEDYVDMYGRPERVPLFCTAAGLRLPRTGDTHTAAPCP